MVLTIVILGLVVLSQAAILAGMLRRAHRAQREERAESKRYWGYRIEAEQERDAALAKLKQLRIRLERLGKGEDF